MTLEKDVAVLSGSALFGAVDPAQLRLLALMAEARTFLDGEPLMVQGADGDAAFVVIEGLADVCVAADDGSETRVAALGPTEIVGEMALLTGNPRTATVRARGEVKALRLERDTMMRILGEFPGMSVELLRVMTRRLEQTTHELSEARAAGARATGAA